MMQPTDSNTRGTTCRDSIEQLDEAALRIFEAKGKENEPSVSRVGNANAATVRRVLQVIKTLLPKPISKCRILDLACGEGVYAIEAALQGAEVVGIDARNERLSLGLEIAKRQQLDKIVLQRGDVRHVSTDSHGWFDVVLLLGILYHLDVPDSFEVLEKVSSMCRSVLIIDTHVAPYAETTKIYHGETFGGFVVREHGDDDPPEERQKKILMSIDNTFSFQFTKKSLVRLLNKVGFSLVFECHAPLTYRREYNRVTLVALKSEFVELATYPWINEKSEKEIAELIAEANPQVVSACSGFPKTAKQTLKSVMNNIMRPLGFEIRRYRNQSHDKEE